MELEARIGNAIRDTLELGSAIMDRIVGVAPGGRNIEYSATGKTLKDENRIAGHVKIIGMPHRPMPERGVYEDATWTEFMFRVQFVLHDDLDRGKPERAVYQALVSLFKRRRFFGETLQDPEGNLPNRDGEVEVAPEVVQVVAESRRAWDARIMVRVCHRTDLQEEEDVKAHKKIVTLAELQAIGAFANGIIDMPALPGGSFPIAAFARNLGDAFTHPETFTSGGLQARIFMGGFSVFAAAAKGLQNANDRAQQSGGLADVSGSDGRANYYDAWTPQIVFDLSATGDPEFGDLGGGAAGIEIVLLYASAP